MWGIGSRKISKRDLLRKNKTQEEQILNLIRQNVQLNEENGKLNIELEAEKKNVEALRKTAAVLKDELAFKGSDQSQENFRAEIIGVLNDILSIIEDEGDDDSIISSIQQEVYNQLNKYE